MKKKRWYNLIRKYGWVRYIYNTLQYIKNKFSKDYKPDNKVFVIGLNKTGTTSIEKVLLDFGYKLGSQVDAELISDYVLKGNVKYLLEYVKTADAFQDQPLSSRGIYKVLHKQYPNAKFILTIRDNEDVWYESLVNFTKKRFVDQNILTEDILKISDIKKLKYQYPLMDYNMKKLIWLRDRHILDDDQVLFDEDYCKFYYNKHMKEVKEYFSENPNLSILNVGEKGSYKALCDFLGKEPLYEDFPHLNKTK